MKKRRDGLTICVILCVFCMCACTAKPKGSVGFEPSTPVKSSPSSSDPLSTPTEASPSPTETALSEKTLSWPREYMDFDWPEGGFEKTIDELGFEGLDLGNSFVMEERIAYEDETLVIFWSQQGVFGLSLGTGMGDEKLTFGLDFVKLFGREGTSQGSHCTAVAVRQDGKRMVIGDWNEEHTAPMESWYLVDIPTLTYEKAELSAGLPAYGEAAGGELLWTDEVFNEADVAGSLQWERRLGETIYIREHGNGGNENVVPVFRDYMEFKPFS